MKRLLCYSALVLICPIVLLSCKGRTHHGKEHGVGKLKTAVVVRKKVVIPLNFAGTLNPISHVNVMSPVEGVVKNMFFDYGSVVKKGQRLVSIDSDALLKQFNSAVTAFIKAKQAYFTNLSSYQGYLTQYKYGIISRSQMLTQESTHSNNVLTFYQAKDALQKILAIVNIDPQTIENLTLEKVRDINTVFKDNFDHIIVGANGDGVALYPISTGSSGEDKTDSKIFSGQAIKKNGLIVSIGDLSGYKAALQVNEIQVNKVKVGMPVTVTGDAFSGIRLKGKVLNVATQASPGASGGGMSLFDVSIIVNKVPKAAKRIIRVGMSCRIELKLEGKSMLMIPIRAVIHRYSGGSFVQVLEPGGQKKQVSVLTGLTTPAGDVAILMGLKEGQKVILHHD